MRDNVGVDTWDIIEQARANKGSASDDYAGVPARLIAAIVDGIILAVPMTVVAFVLMVIGIFALASGGDSGSAGSGTFTCMACLIVPVILLCIFLYSAGFESSRFMATPGKMLLGIIVTDLYGNQLTFGQAMTRAIFKYILNGFFYIGSLYILISDRKQGLYDVIAGTVVVKKD